MVYITMHSAGASGRDDQLPLPLDPRLEVRLSQQELINQLDYLSSSNLRLAPSITEMHHSLHTILILRPFR